MITQIVMLKETSDTDEWGTIMAHKPLHKLAGFQFFVGVRDDFGKNTMNSLGRDKGTPSILILFTWPLKVLDSEKNSCFCSVTLLIGCIHISL